MHVSPQYCYMEVKSVEPIPTSTTTNGNQFLWKKIHSQSLKGTLGMNRSTTNILVRGEIGRHWLQAYILNRNINYIKYVENKCNTTLVTQALNYKQSNMECRPTVVCLL